MPRWNVSIQADYGKGEASQLILKGRDLEQPFHILGATSSNKHVDVSFIALPEDDPEGDYRVRVIVDADAPVGALEAKIILSTDLKQQRRIRIPVVAKVMGPINFFPARIVLFADRSGRPPRLSGTIVLQARPGTEPFEIASTEVNEESLELTPLSEGKMGTHRIAVTWKDPKATGVHNGVIRLQTTNDTMPEIQVPYQVRIQ